MQISDDLYLGPAWAGGGSTSSGPSPMDVGVGPMGRVVFFNVVPLTLQAAGLAALQTTAGAGNLTLTAGTGVTTSVDATGTTRYVLDTPRNITLTSGGNISAVTFTVSGYDVYGQAMTEAITGPNANTVGGNKAFKSITKVAVNGAVGTSTSVGFGDKLGLPFALLDVGYVAHLSWASTLARDTGTATAADTTSPATSSTGDVRGTYAPSSASNGSRRLVMGIHLTGAQCGPSATRASAFGVTQA
jgi:hypothetical protein